jgi:hypothetical protein
MSIAGRVSGLLFALTLLIGGVGCGSSSNSGSGGGVSMNDVAAQMDAQESARRQAEAEASAQKSEEEAAQAAASREPQRRQAGREGVAPGGYYSAIVGARRHVLNQVESWAWKQAVQHFKAEHGRKPKDHAEFMAEIVNRHGIDLGFKEENQEFLYDPAAESDGDLGVLYVVQKGAAQE